jgi:hypothetical protein
VTPSADAGAPNACAGVNLDVAIGDLATVAVDVLSANWSALLDQLASQPGHDIAEVKCAVSLFVGMFEKRAEIDATSQLQRERAQMWLHANGG